MMSTWIGLSLAAATLVSEDAATVTAGLLALGGHISSTQAVVWVALGIWAGDVALFGLGRLAGRVPMLCRWVERRCPSDQRARLATRLEGRAMIAIFASRFVPGSRVPLYVAAGLFPIRLAVFAIVTAVATLVWTTVIVCAIGISG